MTLKTAVFLCAMAFTSAVSAESYKISDISYSITGKTQGSALDRNLDINKKKVYESKEDFDVFLSDLKNQLESERTFKSASVEAEFGEAGEDGVIPVTLSIHAEDSHSMFLLPYPKYKSDDGDFPSGGTLKLKFKDYNFLGLMNTLNVDFHYRANFVKEKRECAYVGFNMSLKTAENERLLPVSELKYGGASLTAEGGISIARHLWIDASIGGFLADNATLLLADPTTDYAKGVLLPDMEYYNANYWRGHLQLTYEIPLKIKGKTSHWFIRAYGDYLKTNNSLDSKCAGLSIGLFN